MHDRAPRRPDEQFSKVVLSSIGVCFNGLVKADPVHSEIGMPSCDPAHNIESGCRVCVFLAIEEVERSGPPVSGIKTPHIRPVVGRVITHLVSRPFVCSHAKPAAPTTFRRVRGYRNVAVNNVGHVSDMSVDGSVGLPVTGDIKDNAKLSGTTSIRSTTLRMIELCREIAGIAFTTTRHLAPTCSTTEIRQPRPAQRMPCPGSNRCRPASPCWSLSGALPPVPDSRSVRRLHPQAGIPAATSSSMT